MSTARAFEIVRSFAVGTLVTLYVIDLSKQGGGVYRFTNNVFEERIPIRFNSQTYIQMPIAMEEIAVDAQGQPAQPRLSIATSGGPTASLIAAYKDLKGAKVWRIKTYAEFLDDRPNGYGGVEPNPSADGQATSGIELFVVDRKLSADPVFAEFQLVAPTDQEGVMLPLRIVRKRWCDWEYRYYNAQTGNFEYTPQVDGGCPYAGGAYFDKNDQPTTKANDRCSKQGSGCLLRFGKASALPMGAFPGVRGTMEA